MDDSRNGRVEVICGPMFAGKTEELLRRVRRAVIAGRDVRLYTHTLDTRSGLGVAASHIGVEHPSISVSSAAEISPPDTTDIVAIDEAHFFGPSLADVAGRLAGGGFTVMIAGLDVMFSGQPFEPLPTLMALAERVDKLTAICTMCGRDAIFHIRVAPVTSGAGDLAAEHVGGTEKYQARCRRHARF